MITDSVEQEWKVLNDFKIYDFEEQGIWINQD